MKDIKYIGWMYVGLSTSCSVTQTYIAYDRAYIKIMIQIENGRKLKGCFCKVITTHDCTPITQGSITTDNNFSLISKSGAIIVKKELKITFRLTIRRCVASEG